MDRRAAIALAACLVIVATGLWAFSGRGRAEASPVSPQDRRAGLRFDGVSAADQAWIEAAVAQARPEAATLIDEVDGLVTVRTADLPGAPWVGMTSGAGDGRFTIVFNLADLDGRRTIDRDVVVLHELGHVVDFVLVPDDVVDRLAAQVPVTGTCRSAESGDCSAVPERFADTFAKWALRGAVSVTGAGYSIPMPASIEDWGAPLGALAIRVQSASA
jgi:hypothetical protein